MPSPSPSDVTLRLAAVWADTLSLTQPPEVSLRLFRELDSTKTGETAPPGMAASSSASASAVRRLRPEGDPTPGADYRLGKAIGQGGMGVVHSAWQESVGRRVALKLVRSDRRVHPQVEERFRAEAALTGALEHPGIVPVYDLGADESGRTFFAMKLVSGQPWSDSIRDLPLADNIAILLRVAEAVAFAHGQNVIHADLKPANIMLGAFGEVLLLDWGLALHHGPEGARPLAPGAPVGGTPSYMAPEQALQELAAISPATDVYLLGAILYEIVGGRRPHAGDSLRSCLAAAAANELVPVEGDPELLAIARHALATRPGDRHPDVAALIADLRAWRSHADSTAMLERARELVAGDSLAGCADAQHAITEARARWPENPHADACESAVRQTWAQKALRAGDAGLAATAARAQVAGETELHAEAEALAASQRRQARRLVRLRVGLAGLVLLLLGGLALGRHLVAEAEATARRAQAQAEAARDQAKAAAYRAQLARALAAVAGGDRDQALAALAACPPELRGIEWRTLRTQGEETVRSLPGFPDGALCLAWVEDGRSLWVGTASEAVLVLMPEGRIARRHALPAPPSALATSPAGVLIGTSQGCLLLPGSGGDAITVPGSGPVKQVALAGDGACLWVDGKQAWRWRPGETAATLVAEAALLVAWQDGVPVVATATQVLVDGRPAFTVPDGEIVDLRWNGREQLVLLRRGPRIDAGGNVKKPEPGQAADAPAEPTYELRRGDGTRLLRAEQYYLDRDPCIAAEGLGFTVVHARYHAVLLYTPDGVPHRAVFPEPIVRAARSRDGILAVAWKGGVGLQPPTPSRHGLHLLGDDVTIAMAYAGPDLGLLDCWGKLILRSAAGERDFPRGEFHQGHTPQPWRLQALPGRRLVAVPHRDMELITATGAAESLASPSRPQSSLGMLFSPDGSHYATRSIIRDANRRYRKQCQIATLGGDPVGPRREADPLGWIDDGCLLVIEGEDLVAREVPGWQERWRQAGCVVEAGQLLLVADQLVLIRSRFIEVRQRTDGGLRLTLDRHRHAITTLAISDGRLVSGDAGGNLAFWELPGFQLLAFCPWSKLSITALAGAEGRLAVATEERLVHTWEPAP